MIKRVIYTILLILWMVVIFMFSNQNADASQSTSDKIASNIVDAAEVVTKQEISNEKKNDFIEDTRVLVRKSAHFILYLILGTLSYLTLKNYGVDKRLVLYSVLFCFIYAISDEVHQLFSDGRTFKILDILIDTTGGLLGSLVCFFVNRFIH